MATRLPADETGKESKWADIDDDEDDWAPESVTWLDGTKSTVAVLDAKLEDQNQQLLQQSPQPPPAELQQQHQPVLEPQPEEPNSVESFVSTPTPADTMPVPQVQKPLASTTKTILKPGSHTLAQSKGSGSLVLRGGPDKSQKASGSISSLPAKSPWAPLPPIDKVSPVLFVPPVQAPPPLRFPRDPTGFDAFQTAISPKEIEADDFHRAYDQPRHRELFNSQSGRFEPANDSRKGQARAEHGHRQPAVLQRPSGGQPSPAEPSAAFQTSRSGMENSHWPRHRTGSMSSAGRRMSMSRSQDMVMDVATSPALSNRDLHQQVSGVSGTGAQGIPNQRQWPGASPAPSNAQLEPPAEISTSDVGSVVGDVTLPVGPQEDQVTKQQRLMREKIEAAKLAKQRRMEEEDREEKARKERLRLKMEALNAVASPSPPAAEIKEKSRDGLPAKSPQAFKAAQIASPPKPPVPTVAGEVVNYGMMKLHQPHPVKKSNLSENALMNRGQADSQAERRPMYHGEQNHRPVQGPRVAGGEMAPEASPWRGATQDSYGGWGSSTSSNVWGPPETKNRALGNGTFDTAAYSRMHGTRAIGAAGQVGPAAAGQASQTGPFIQAPGPIAPPSAIARRSHESHGAGAPASGGAQSVPANTKFVDKSNFAHPQQQSQPPPLHLAHPSQTDKRLLASGPNLGSTNSAAMPIDETAVTARWHAFTKTTQDKNETDHASRPWKPAEFTRNAQPMNIKYERSEMRDGVPVTITEHVNSTVDPVTGQESILVNGIPTSRERLGQSQPPPSFAQATPAVISDSSMRMNGEISDRNSSPVAAISQQSTASQAMRSMSRFFPRSGATEASETSNSPPPPELSSLDEGPVSASPVVVNIPRVPIVKLPPPQPADTGRDASPGPLDEPTGGLKNTAQPPSSDWQAKIDVLLRKSRGPVGVFASSRAPLDTAAQSRTGATVSLPAAIRTPPQSPFSIDTSSAVDSKCTDEDLFEQPEFASLPTVKVPAKDSVYAQAGQPQVKRYSSHHSVIARFSKEVEKEFTISRVVWDVCSGEEKSLVAIVRLDPNSEPKSFPLPTVPGSAVKATWARSPSSSYRGRRGHDSTTHGRGGRRAPSAQYSPRENTTTSSPARGGAATRVHRGSSNHNGQLLKRAVSSAP
jgi:hypothetical protein